MIAIIDYGVGNLLSVEKALKFLNVDAVVTDSIEDIKKAEKIIIPGVGAFSDAMKSINERNLLDVIRQQAVKKPTLGICLGMQLLFTKGYEFTECDGLGLIKGEVKMLENKNLKIPHMGWNDIKITNNSQLLNGINEGDYVYFVHSYKAVTEDENINAYCEYGEKIPALVSSGTVYGAQFHPEKSSDVGLKILKNFSLLK